MDYILARIRRLILEGKYQFTMKADLEMLEDGLDEMDVLDAISSAQAIEKTLNSHNPKTGKREKLYVIKGRTYDDLLIYTRGKIDYNHFYILISAKRAL